MYILNLFFFLKADLSNSNSLKAIQVSGIWLRGYEDGKGVTKLRCSGCNLTEVEIKKKYMKISEV